jgi:hypothetical protein
MEDVVYAVRHAIAALSRIDLALSLGLRPSINTCPVSCFTVISTNLAKKLNDKYKESEYYFSLGSSSSATKEVYLLINTFWNESAITSNFAS